MPPDVEMTEVMQYGAALLLMVLAVIVAVGMVFVSHLISPRNPTPEKQLSYECGEDPIGNAWLRFNIRFYVVALVFVLFDVEVALIYPVAALFKGLTTGVGTDWTPALLVFGELLFFVAVLFLGLVYVWKKGDLGWVRTFRMPTEQGLRSWQPAQPSLEPAEKTTR